MESRRRQRQELRCQRFYDSFTPAKFMLPPPLHVRYQVWNDELRYMCRGQKVFFPNSDVNTNLLGLIESTFVIERSVINMKVNDHMFLLKLKERSFGVIGGTCDTKVINGSNGISSSETILIASRIFCNFIVYTI